MRRFRLVAAATRNVRYKKCAERNQIKRSFLFVNTHPIVTIGREGSLRQLIGSEQELKAGQIEVRWINRGGGALFHAPGQLAVYPVIPLKRIGLGNS